MNKLVYGVGVNDLGYRVHVLEDVTKNGGRRAKKTVFLCKYYTAWKRMLERCYSKKYLERNPSYIGARNLSNAGNAFVNRNFALMGTSSGLTSTEVSTLYTIVQQYQTILNRQV